MALAGQGDPTSRSSHPLAGLALRSSVLARQRAPGDGAAEEPGNLGKGCGGVAGSARSSSPRVGGMARQSGFRGVGRSVKPDSGDCTPRGGVVVELF